MRISKTKTVCRIALFLAFFFLINAALGFFLEPFQGSSAEMWDHYREKKHLDMVAANNLKVAGAGFQGDTNVLTLITQDEDVSLQLMSKEDAANVILDKILSVMKEREE